MPADLKFFVSQTLTFFSFRLQGLAKRLAELIPAKRDEIKKVRTELGDKLIGTCSVEQVRTQIKKGPVQGHENLLGFFSLR